MAAIAGRADDNFVAFLHIGDVRPHCRRYTGRFMTGNERKMHVPANAFDCLIVGGANPARSYPHHRFIGTRLRDRPILQDELIEIS
jgi:hypothetical protein